MGFQYFPVVCNDVQRRASAYDAPASETVYTSGASPASAANTATETAAFECATSAACSGLVIYSSRAFGSTATFGEAAAGEDVPTSPALRDAM